MGSVMFGSTLAKEQAFGEAEWRRRAARPATFVAARDGVDVGMAGVYEFDDAWCAMGMWIAPGRGAPAWLRPSSTPASP